MIPFFLGFVHNYTIYSIPYRLEKEKNCKPPTHHEWMFPQKLAALCFAHHDRRRVCADGFRNGYLSLPLRGRPRADLVTRTSISRALKTVRRTVFAPRYANAGRGLFDSRTPLLTKRFKAKKKHSHLWSCRYHAVYHHHRRRTSSRADSSRCTGTFFDGRWHGVSGILF